MNGRTKCQRKANSNELHILNFTQNTFGDQIKVNEMTRACTVCEGDEIHFQNFSQKTFSKDIILEI